MSDNVAVERFRLALALYESGESMMREKLRRDQPDASAADIERQLLEWLRERPGAELGDCPGSEVPWPIPDRRTE